MKRPRKWLTASATATLLLIPTLSACANDTADQNKPKIAQNDLDKASEQTENAQKSKGAVKATESGNKQTGTTQKQTGNEQTLTQSEVLQAIEKELHTKLPKKLPKQLPLKTNKHLTATTSATGTSYEVVFYETDKPVPINNKALKKNTDNATRIAKLHVNQYASEAKAAEQIGYTDYAQAGGSKVDLGHRIIGYQDAGAGSVFTSWNEGRWALEARALTSEAEKGRELAKQAVAYLEEHALPAPQRYGAIHLDTEGNGNRAVWQKGKLVYEVDKVRDPMDVLHIVQAFK